MNHGPCSQCKHFRSVRPASQLLSLALGQKVAGAEVTNALAHIVQDEQGVREAETQVKAKKANTDHEDWAVRPMMSAYCGLHESEEVFLIAEVKNRGMKCTDFREGKIERHSCVDCVYRIPATGYSRDNSLNEGVQRMVLAAIALQAPSPQEHLSSLRAGATARKASELSDIYSAKGRAFLKPLYFDHCSYFSSEDEYVTCAIKNSHGSCMAWRHR